MMNKKLKTWLALCIVGLTFFSSCNSEKKKGDENSTNYALPTANGAIGEIYLLMDSAKWNSDLGDQVRAIFNEQLPGLIQNEKRFNVSYIRPQAFNRVLERTKNLVFITSLESNSADTDKLRQFYGDSLEAKLIRSGKAIMQVDSDKYARGQKILNIVSGSDAGLLKLLKDKKSAIQNFFAQADIERIRAKMKFDTHLSKELEKEHGFYINIPDGYKVAKDTAGFIWLRQPDVKWDKYLIVAYKDYTSEKEFNYDNIIHFRDSICKEFIYGNPENKNSYVVTSVGRFAPDSLVTELDGRYAKELRGHWQTNNVTMGGPFVGYTLTNKDNSRLYYVEGFLYAPSNKNMPFIRELEAVLTSFKTN